MADTYHPRGVLIEGYRVREHPLYWTWADMKSRCNDPKQGNYPIYGGRGITYCEEWRHFANFVRDMGPKPSPEYTLERGDVDGNYTPDNCFWATRTEQCYNRRVFKNNTTGVTGVVVTRAGTFEARFDFKKKRYRIGCYKTVEAASEARARFIESFQP